MIQQRQHPVDAEHYWGEVTEIKILICKKGFICLFFQKYHLVMCAGGAGLKQHGELNGGRWFCHCQCALTIRLRPPAQVTIPLIACSVDVHTSCTVDAPAVAGMSLTVTYDTLVC